MKFDFYFKRTCFRTMTLFYKTSFKPFYDVCRSKRKTLPVADLIKKFATNNHPGLVESLAQCSKLQSLQFPEMLKMLVFCHRHSKNDPFLATTPVDFSVVREPMYKYSKIAQDRFFDYPAFAYLYCFFMKDKQAQKFSS